MRVRELIDKLGEVTPDAPVELLGSTGALAEVVGIWWIMRTDGPGMTRVVLTSARLVKGE